MKKLLMAIAAVISAVVTGFADVTVASADGTITVTIPANTVTVSAPVYLVWDTSDKGDDLADWTNKAKLGEVGAEGGTFDVAGATHSIPNGAAIRAFITANRIYMAVDYLQSSGGAYIDTGLKLTQADKMTCDFGITDQVPASTYWWIAGSRTSSTANSFVCFVQSGDDADHLKVFVDYSSYLTSRAGSTTGDLKTQLIVGNRYTAVNCSTERSVTLADASDPFLCDTRTISDTFTTYGNVFLFYANAPEKGGLPSGSAKFTGRIYSYKVERGDEVLQDLVPALNDSGVACMFDKTNGEYLQNVGAGTLTYGGTPHEESVPVSGMADEIASDTAIYAASEPPTPVGGVELSSADGTITVTVDANTVTESTPVYLVWDTSDKGDDLADWTNKANLGDVTAAGGTFNVTGATHSIANGAAIRAFVMAGDKVDLYASLTKPKAVSGLVDLGYSPGKTVGTSGIDIDFKIENLSLGSGVTYIFFGICDYSSEAATEAGNTWGENFHVACGSTAYGYYHIQARPQANDHKDYKTANYTIAPPNVQILATRHLLRARTGEVPSLLLGGVTAYSAESPWPAELTWDYAPGTVAVFGRNDNPPKAESPRYFQYGDMTLYGLKIYEKKQEAHVCVRDYVPAAKNGTKGLYETISGGFYPASAANFTLGGSATNTVGGVVGYSAAATYSATPAPRKKQGLIIYGTR